MQKVARAPGFMVAMLARYTPRSRIAHEPDVDLDGVFEADDVYEEEVARIKGWLFVLSRCDALSAH